MRSSKSKSLVMLEAALIGTLTLSFGACVDRVGYGR